MCVVVDLLCIKMNENQSVCLTLNAERFVSWMVSIQALVASVTRVFTAISHHPYGAGTTPSQAQRGPRACAPDAYSRRNWSDKLQFRVSLRSPDGDPRPVVAVDAFSRRAGSCIEALCVPHKAAVAHARCLHGAERRHVHHERERPPCGRHISQRITARTLQLRSCAVPITPAGPLANGAVHCENATRRC